MSVFHRAGVCVVEIECCMHICDLMDLILAIPLGGVTKDGLDAAVDQFLQRALDAHWHRWIGPKWHWLVHIGMQLLRFGCLLSCFVHERKHRTIKRFADGHRNTARYEEGILSDVTLQHFAEMKDPLKFDRSPRLVPPISTCNKQVSQRIYDILPSLLGHEIMTARRARVTEHEVCHVRDVVLFYYAGNIVFGQIWFFFSSASECIALVALWPTVSKEPKYGSATVQMDENQVRTVPLCDLIAAVTYKRRSDGNATVLVPSTYRGSI